MIFMDAYQIYKIIHVVGVLFLFLSVGAVVIHSIGGGEKSAIPARKLVAASHGIGLLLLLVSGFGLLARLQIPWPFPNWIWAKVIIWLLFAFVNYLVFVAYSGRAIKLWFLYLILGSIAAFLGIVKPT